MDTLIGTLITVYLVSSMALFVGGWLFGVAWEHERSRHDRHRYERPAG